MDPTALKGVVHIDDEVARPLPVFDTGYGLNSSRVCTFAFATCTIHIETITHQVLLLV